MSHATLATTLTGAHNATELRRATCSDASSLAGIAEQLGCAPSAIVQLSPFLVDDSFVTVLAPATLKVRNADLITCLGAAVVRRLAANEFLLGFLLGRSRHRVCIDDRVFEHEEVFLCVNPPRDYAGVPPIHLQSELRARLISLPSALKDDGLPLR